MSDCQKYLYNIIMCNIYSTYMVVRDHVSLDQKIMSLDGADITKIAQCLAGNLI